MDTTPVLLAYPSKHTSHGLKVWCSWCRTWHFHGDLEGHRVAHCGTMNERQKASPFHETGYILKKANV